MRPLYALAVSSGVLVTGAASCGSNGLATSGATSKSTGSASGEPSTSGSTSTGHSSGGSSGGGAGGQGTGGSTGALMLNDGGGPCPGYKGDCAAQGFDCGAADDGCGDKLNCGTCAAGQTCGAVKPNVCSVPCTPKSCAEQGFDCGSATDGCNDVIECGACDGGVCGANNTPNVCGAGTCTPKSCADQGFDCGTQSDTCGGTMNCGSSCPTGQVCGANNVVGVCGTPACTPKSCADQGFNCGMATDGCNNVLSCGTCTGSDVCGENSPNVCGAAPCTGLCKQQTTCTGMATTSVSGTVYAPNGTDPIYNALVYVPNGSAGAPTYGVEPFAPGVHCGACGSEVTGSPLVSTNTAVDGTFTLTNVPVGSKIPLVIQDGRWRRKVTIPTVAKCTNTALSATLTSLPSTQAQGDPADNIPLMAFSTGSADVLECVLLKIGVSSTEFSDPAEQGGTGRIRLYTGEGQPGASYSANTPSAPQLWDPGNDAGGPDIMQYDTVFFPCQGNTKGDVGYPKTTAQQQVVIDYANAGGRVFGTHLSYTWFNDDPPFSTTADWDPSQAGPADQTGYIDTSFARGLALADWLQDVGASSTLGQIPLNTLRHDFNGVVAPSLLWISVGTAPSTVPMHYTFDTPVGSPASAQCGRVLFDDFHVENADTSPATRFPAECSSGAMTAQEKLLEFMIFDLGSCVAPLVCTPKTCMDLGAACGPAGDGCGNILQCGTCPSNQACVSNACQGCTPATCAEQNLSCGMQGDGCGNVLDCGTCDAGTTCQGGTCESGSCTPKTCSTVTPPAQCGEVGDGCGDVIDCGTCPSANEVCGGGGVANQCYTPPCTAQSCADQGYTCGMATDGCGGTLNCGTCAAGQICGGCGAPNVCCSSG